MEDKAKQIIKKMLDIWNKYTSKQKTLIISALCIVVFAFALLFFLMQRTEYSELTVAETPSQASSITKLLAADGIKYKTGSDHLSISVDSTRLSDAIYLLADNDIPSTGITVDELLNNSLSTTNYDRTLKLNLYFQNQLRNKIKEMKGIKDAEVIYIPTEGSTSILTEEQDTSASVFLKTTDEFDTSTAETIAEVVATAIGNKDAKKIKVTDQNANLLYGGESDLYSASPSSKLDFKEKLSNTYANDVYMLLIKSGYDDAAIVPNLALNMDKVEEILTERLPAEGQEQGLLSHSYTYNSENADASGGTPGTDSNNETSYQMPDTSSASGKVKIEEYDYIPSDRVTKTAHDVGDVITEKSTISIVVRRAVTYREEVLQAQGSLTGTTFDAYATANSGLKKLPDDASLKTSVSMATGIAEANISITAYELPIYVPKVTIVKPWTDYLQIILAVLIVALLVFVVFKGVGPVEVTELEPELSVEQLLATTKENQSIEDIEFNEVSEVRRMIEKFVDEKPEAVAQLLRNWLNEDWN